MSGLKFTIFPNAKALPGSKEEKVEESKYTWKKADMQIVEIKNEDEMAQYILNNAWSPSLFNGDRTIANFVSTDFIALDVDDGMTVQEAEAEIKSKNLTAFIFVSTSHTKEHHKFRVIFPLVYSINNVDDYKHTWKKLFEIFPKSDKICKDPSRFYFACKEDELNVFIQGDLMNPSNMPSSKFEEYFSNIKRIKEVSDENIKYANMLYQDSSIRVLPEAVSYFIENAATGIEGGWIDSLNRAVFILSIQGCEYENILKVIEEVAPNELDDRDIKCIDYAYNCGIKEKEKKEDEFEL